MYPIHTYILAIADPDKASEIQTPLSLYIKICTKKFAAPRYVALARSPDAGLAGRARSGHSICVALHALPQAVWQCFLLATRPTSLPEGEMFFYLRYVSIFF